MKSVAIIILSILRLPRNRAFGVLKGSNRRVEDQIRYLS